MKNDLISIIIPVYKVEKYLEKCIESVLKQTYTNLQIILVDDGSPDNCGKICDEYDKKDSRIEVIHKANGGLSDARNVGISKAKGRYIGFVDSDDYIKEDMYEILLNLIKKYDADVSICNLYDVIDGNECIRNKENGIREYSRLDILKEVLLDKNIQSYAWNKLYEKELFDEIKYPIGKKYEDIGTTLPKLVGKYKATLSVTNQNYTASNASVDFEITPITTEVKIKSYDDTFTYDGTEHTKNAYDVLWANNASPVTDNKLPNGDLVTAEITGKVRDVKDTALENNTIGKITNPRKKIKLGSKKRYAAVVSFLTNTRLRFDGFTADFKENTILSITFWLKIPSSGIPARRGFHLSFI